jgi:anti-sigma B factor antagonist
LGVVLALHHQIGGQVVSRHIEPFTCNVTPERDHVIVAPRGELDMATVGAVDQELRRLHDAGFRKIVLDLGGLSFMDSSGLHLVMGWVAEASRNGFEFELEPGPRAVQRVFDLAAVTDGLPFRKRPQRPPAAQTGRCRACAGSGSRSFSKRG